MKWEEIRRRMFVRCEVLDHCEHGDECDSGGGPYWYRDYGPHPFRVWGQVSKVAEDYIVVEGAWQWVGKDCDELPIEYNCFTVVRGALLGEVEPL